MYFITTKRMLEVCFSAHPNIQYRTFYTNNRATAVKAKHSTIPQTVGTRKDITVHLRLPDSFRIVRRVVVQGQCIREKSMVLTAVIQVQPLFTSNSLSCARLSNSRRLPWAM